MPLLKEEDFTFSFADRQISELKKRRELSAAEPVPAKPVAAAPEAPGLYTRIDQQLGGILPLGAPRSNLPALTPAPQARSISVPSPALSEGAPKTSLETDNFTFSSTDRQIDEYRKRRESLSAEPAVPQQPAVPSIPRPLTRFEAAPGPTPHGTLFGKASLAPEKSAFSMVPAHAPTVPPVSDPSSLNALQRLALKKPEELTLPQKAVRSWATGVGDVVSTAGSTLKWLGAKKVGEKLKQAGDVRRQAYEVPTKEFSWKSFLDPEFYAADVARAMPFSVSLIPAAVLGGLTGVAGATAIGLGTFGKAVLGAIGGGVLSRTIESALEAGGTHDEALRKGMTPEQADEAASRTFKGNMKLAGVDTAQLLAAFAPVKGIKSLTRIATKPAGRAAIAAGRMAGVAGMEAAEEGVQETIQRKTLGEPVTFDPEMQKAMALGGVMGAGMGATGAVYQRIKDSVVARLPEEAKAVFDETVATGIQAGMTPEQAEENALNTVAETPAGETLVQEAVQEIAAEIDAQAPAPASVEVMPETGEAAPLAAETPVIVPAEKEAALTQPAAPLTPKVPAAATLPATEPAGFPGKQALEVEIDKKPEARQVAEKPKETPKQPDLAPGNLVGLQGMSEAFTVVDASNPAMVTVRNSKGTDINVGRKVVTAAPAGVQEGQAKAVQEPVAQPQQQQPQRPTDAELEKEYPRGTRVSFATRGGVPLTGVVEFVSGGQLSIDVDQTDPIGGRIKIGRVEMIRHDNSSLKKEEVVATKPSPEAALPTGKERTLADYGLKVKATRTKNGNPVHEVSGNTEEHRAVLRRAGGRWYGPKKVWSFYSGDPTQKLLVALPALQEAAPEAGQGETPAAQKTAEEVTPPPSKIVGEEVKSKQEKPMPEVTASGERQSGTSVPVEPVGVAGRKSLEEVPAENVPGTEGEGAVGESPVRSAGTYQPGGDPGYGGTGEVPSESEDGRLPGTLAIQPVVVRHGVGDGKGDVDTSPGRGDRAEAGRKPSRVEPSGQPGGNYRITEADNLGQGGLKQKYRDNVAAIKLLKQIEAESRLATAEEQSVLVKYVGWGGMPQVFGAYGQEWGSERNEIKELLNDEEYRAARASTTNAHYTSVEVIQGMHKGLQRLGLDGGRILEPSMGVGHFLGLMPQPVANRTKWTGVELDKISGRIAKQLYQKADIRVEGFETSVLPDDFYDAAMSNVPFGDYKLHDPKYNKYGFNIHDYFFAKSLDKVRPGGLIMFITSRYSMDKTDQKVRRYLNQKADLVGAIRLPNTAFKGNANTEVTTDIIILKKRAEGETQAGEPWMGLEVIKGKNGEEIKVNEYFARHPEMMLGEMALEGSMYRGGEPALVPDGRNIAEALSEAFEQLPAKVITKPASGKKMQEEPSEPTVPAPGDVKQNAFVVKEGKVYQRKGSELHFEDTPATTVERISGMIGIRDAVRQVLRLQIEDAPEGQITKAQKAFNEIYDAFVKRYGYLHENANKTAYKRDPDAPLLLSLEVYGREAKTAKKAAIFSKRTLLRQKKIERVDTAKEALVVSLNETGRINWARMSRLTGKEFGDLREELRGLIFQTPNGYWETADEYLSGTVREKLAEAEGAAKNDEDFKENVDALRTVQPEDLKPVEIDARLGTPWISTTDIEDFINQLLDVQDKVTVEHSSLLGAWTVTEKASRWASALGANVANTKKWGISRYPAVNLILDALNLRFPTVYNYVDDKPVVNQQETLAAREKQQAIKDQFKKWIWEDPERRERLARKYNDEYNNIRLQTFDGEHLTLPGIAANITLHPHQKNAIWRIIQTGNTLLAHVVGAGKTYTMVAAGMELKRLGLSKKPMYVVPNHLLEQWTAEFLRLYPSANVLMATKEDFEPAKRKELMSRIATGDWDAVIVAHSSFQKISMSPQSTKEYVEAQIKELEEAVLAAKAESGKLSNRIVKELEKAKRRLERKLKERIDEESKDITVNFEELGVDQLFIDEAHLFKNLFFATKMGRVAGLPNTDSKRAFDMFMKTQYITKLNNGRGVVFATGTPISNSMAEMFTMQRYLQLSVLKDHGIAHFDSWAANFGEVVTSIELAPDGSGYRPRSRFARFTNLPELAQMFRSVADVQTADMLKLPVPALAGGKPSTVTAPPTEELKDFVQDLVSRAEAIRTGRVSPSDDNMLAVTNDGRKAALDMRMMDPNALDYQDSKLNKLVDNVYQIWRDNSENKSAQLVFSDLSTPKKEGEGFSAYNDIKAKLIQKGVPKKEIAFIHDAKSDAEKQALFDKVNEGRVRVLIGSTEKMGAGMNVQQKLIALHHLDAPWRPSDIEQREGRILRQGNANPEVRIYRYVTEGSFDAYMWQTLESKARFIAQVMNGDVTSRSADDVEGLVLTYAEVKALASGNPLVLKKVQVDTEVRKLQALLAQHNSARHEMQSELARIPLRIKAVGEDVGEIRQDIAKRKDTKGDAFKITVEGVSYKNRKDAGGAILAAAKLNENKRDITPIGSFAGFNVVLDHKLVVPVLKLLGKITYTVREVKPGDDPSGLVQSLEYVVRNLENTLAQYETNLAGLQKKQKDLEKQVNVPFEHQKKMEQLLKEQRDIASALDLDKNMAGQAMAGQEEGGSGASGESVDRMATGATARAIPQGTSREGTPVKRLDLLRFIEKKFQLPIHKGRYPFALHKAAGIYKRFARVIRTKKAEDLTAIAHEFGHHLDNIYQWSQGDHDYDGELFALAEALYGPEVADKPEDYQRREGIAEFTRSWLINPEFARGESPQFFSIFEEAIDDDWETGPSIRQLQQLFAQYYAQNPEEMLRAAISWEPEKEPLTVDRARETGREAVRQLYAGLVDAIDPLRVSTQAFELAWRARGYRGVVQAMIEGDKQGRAVIERKDLGPALMTILKPVTASKEDAEQWAEYAVAKRIVYLAEKRGWKDDKFIVPVDTARQIVSSLETPAFKQALDKVRQWSNTLLKHYAASGMLSRESVDAMIKANEVYVPFTRLAMEEGIGGGGRPGTGRKMANLGQSGSTKAMKGGLGTIVNPLESLVRNTFTMVHLAERNRVAAALAHWADSTPGMGYLIEKVPPDTQATLMSAEELARALKTAGVDPEEIKAAMKDLKAALRLEQLSRKASEGTLTAKEETELEGLREYQDQSDLDLSAKVWLYRAYMYPTIQASKEGIVMVWQDGKPAFYQVKDPLIYRALLMLDSSSLPIVQKLLSPMARMLREFATITFEFIGRNVARDSLEAAVFGRGVPFEAMIRGVSDIFGSQKWLNEWRSSGAANTTLNALDRDYLQRELNKILAYRTAGLRRYLLSPRATMREISEIFEEATRVGEFQMAITGKNLVTTLLRRPPRPASRTGAVIEARDVTIDFMRSGPWGRFWNSITAFFNAGVQGIDKFRRVFLSRDTSSEEKARRLARVFMFITLPTILLSLINRDDEDYKRLPQWRKDLFWNIPMGDGHFVPVPINHIVGFLFKVVPERLMGYLEEKDPEAFKGLWKTAGAVLIPNVVPTAVALLTELTSNYSFYLERPIVPASEQRLEPGLQYGPYTSETAKLVGKGVNASPRKVEYAARGVFGGVAMYATDVTDWLLGVTGAVKPPPPSQKDIPVLSRVERAFYIEPVGSGSASMESFYDALSRMETLWASVPKRAGVNRTLGEIEKWALSEVAKYRAEKAKLSAADQQLLTQASKLRSISRELSTLRKKVKDIQGNPAMPTGQKEAQIKKIQKEMDARAAAAVSSLKLAVKKAQ